MVYAATLRESKIGMLWKVIIEEFGPNIRHIAGVDKIVADTLSRFPYKSVDKYDPITSKDQCRANELFSIGRVKKQRFSPLNPLNVQKQQQKELRKINSKFRKFISDWGSCVSKQALDEVEIICNGSRIYAPQTLRRRVLDW